MRLHLVDSFLVLHVLPYLQQQHVEVQLFLSIYHYGHNQLRIKIEVTVLFFQNQFRRKLSLPNIETDEEIENFLFLWIFKKRKELQELIWILEFIWIFLIILLIDIRLIISTFYCKLLVNIRNCHL